jgi:hypothetical protein
MFIVEELQPALGITILALPDDGARKVLVSDLPKIQRSQRLLRNACGNRQHTQNDTKPSQTRYGRVDMAEL